MSSFFALLLLLSLVLVGCLSSEAQFPNNSTFNSTSSGNSTTAHIASSNSTQSTQPVFSPTGTCSGLIQPSDFVYLGAFRFPDTPDQKSRWAYGGWGLTFSPNGDSQGGLDGFPGSLYGIGHDWDQMVSEISIPAPVNSRNAADLPEATTLQPFADITGGLREKANVDKMGDITYLPKQPGQTTDKLYWTVYEYYNAEGRDYLSHGWSELDLMHPRPQGVWRLGPMGTDEFHSMKTSDYMFEIPKEWADLYVGGKYLVSGRHRAAGAFGGSEGPALYAFGPYLDGTPKGSAPAYGAELSAVPLLHYPIYEKRFPNYTPCDYWDGGAWLTDGNKSAILIAGRKGLGETYYGPGRPNDCWESKGYHCDPYQPEFLFYSPDDLAKVATGKLKSDEVVPYATFNPEKYLWPSCSWELGGVAYDRKSQNIYVVQKQVEDQTNPVEPNPLVHVFKLNSSSQCT